MPEVGVSARRRRNPPPAAFVRKRNTGPEDKPTATVSGGGAESEVDRWNYMCIHRK